MGPYGPAPSGNVIPEPVRNRVKQAHGLMDPEGNYPSICSDTRFYHSKLIGAEGKDDEKPGP